MAVPTIETIGIEADVMFAPDITGATVNVVALTMVELAMEFIPYNANVVYEADQLYAVAAIPVT
jgi:hypothetical protein